MMVLDDGEEPVGPAGKPRQKKGRGQGRDQVRCFVCGASIEEYARLVLVRGRVRQAHCSRFCLDENLRARRIAAARARRRWFLTAFVAVLLPSAASLLWQCYRAPPPEWISSPLPEPLPATASVEPTYFGPAWPPTDDDWIRVFNESDARWVYPLPGPIRRACATDDRIFGAPPPADRPATCRAPGRCGVDLGGDLWGEHVYAAHDGVVDHIQAAGNEDRGGQYIRLSHFGGMAFTQYFHLAAVPGGLVRGSHVKAGDIIGLLGDTGLRKERRHLHFTLSVRPSLGFAEVYWDPRPWMKQWPLHVPTRGTVAGLAATTSRVAKAGKGGQSNAEMPRLHRGK
ncbi:MAG: M23 family metallopeptidase [Myxococcales bacterium]